MNDPEKPNHTYLQCLTIRVLASQVPVLLFCVWASSILQILATSEALAALVVQNSALHLMYKKVRLRLAVKSSCVRRLNQIVMLAIGLTTPPSPPRAINPAPTLTTRGC